MTRRAGAGATGDRVHGRQLQHRELQQRRDATAESRAIHSQCAALPGHHRHGEIFDLADLQACATRSTTTPSLIASRIRCTRPISSSRTARAKTAIRMLASSSRPSRVSVTSVTQEREEETYVNPAVAIPPPSCTTGRLSFSMPSLIRQARIHCASSSSLITCARSLTSSSSPATGRASARSVRSKPNRSLIC